ncbi:MAG: AMP-binding protein, partial [candidate division KSB1 bacterium]|nr:AMP-binding protein [candidate division KSB1 bacterium]
MNASTLTEMFLNTVKTHGPKTSLMTKVGGQYQGFSYQELGERVKHFALGLASLGVHRGDRVSLLSENRPEWAIADLAIISLGAINVPIYPTLIPKQIEYILNDSEAKVIITSTAEQTQKILQILRDLPVLKYIIFINPIENPSAQMFSFEQVAVRGQEFEKAQPDYYDKATKAVMPDDP